MSWSDESGNNNDVILLDGVKFNSKYGGYVSFDASLSNSRGYISNDLHYAGGTKVIEELTVLVWMRTNYSNGENTPDGSYDINQSSFIDFDRSEVFNFYLEGAGQLKFSGSSSNSGGFSEYYDLGAGTDELYNDGEWHLLGVTFSVSNQKIKLFADGVLKKTSRLTAP